MSEITSTEPGDPAASDEAGEDMHIHKPKAAHGVREFLSEIGIIVVGVLIALALEQAVEWLHWSSEVQKARSSVHSEIAHNDQISALRAEAEPCVTRRLNAIEDVLEKAASRRPVAQVSDLRLPINYALDDSNWTAHRASQTVTHFNDDELDALGRYYLQLGNLVYFIHLEDDAWSDLSVLNGDPARLGSEDVAALRRSLQRARFYNRMIAGLSREELSKSKALGVAPPRPDDPLLQAICARWP
jgi:hypothetical protein